MCYYYYYASVFKMICRHHTYLHFLQWLIITWPTLCTWIFLLKDYHRDEWDHCCCCCYHLCCCWLLKALWWAVVSTVSLWLWLESIEECSCKCRKCQERPHPEGETRSDRAVGDDQRSSNCRATARARGQTTSLHAICNASVIGMQLSCSLMRRVLL